VIFELAEDFSDAPALIALRQGCEGGAPAGLPKRRMRGLLQEAIRRDIHFIARHPTTMFQCMWNTCWWYDCPDAAKHYPRQRPWVAVLLHRSKRLRLASSWHNRSQAGIRFRRQVGRKVHEVIARGPEPRTRPAR